jgi:hypothetical protein
MPTAESFTAHQDYPGRWPVEGKEKLDESVPVDREEPTVFYGLWIADAELGDIEAYDQLANQFKHGLQCFKQP